jgi:cytochrome c-type biogenesis protein
MVHNVSLGLAFGAGLLSFASPCTLPLFPSYLGYISGISFQNLMNGPAGISASNRWRAFSHAFFFSLGLSFLFVLLGFGATAIGHWLEDYKVTIRLLGGALVLVMGLFMAGVVRSEWLLRERRLPMPAQKPLGYLGSFLVGVAFAAGWTPCIGPILASVLMMIASNPGSGAWYMAAYATGFALPFMVLALTLTSIRPLLKYTGIIEKVGGWLLVVMGLLLITDKMTAITIWIQRITGFSGFNV